MKRLTVRAEQLLDAAERYEEVPLDWTFHVSMVMEMMVASLARYDDLTWLDVDGTMEAVLDVHGGRQLHLNEGRPNIPAWGEAFSQ